MVNKPNNPEYDPVRIVADGFLAQARYDPKEVYAFLRALNGAPDIVDIGFKNSLEHMVSPTVTARYTGSGVWGGKKSFGSASDEFQKTARTIFEAIAAYTGYRIDRANAELNPDQCRAKVILNSKDLSVVVTKSE